MNPARSRSVADPIVLVPLALALALAAHVQASAFLNHDVGSHLVLARRLLDGGEFFDQVLDPNPPFVFWLLTIPNVIADALGWDVVAVFRALAFLTILVSLLAVHAILRRQREWDAATASAMVLAVGLGLLFLPGQDFGQREHLMAAFAAPYIVLAAIRSAGCRTPRGWRLVIGLAAGVGFALKPQYVVIPLAIEATALAAPGRGATRPCPEGIGVASALGAYGIALLLFGRRYLLDVLPLVQSAYGGYDVPVSVLLRSSAFDIALLGGSAALWLRNRGSGAGVFVLLGAVGTIVYVLAGKGWIYQAYPQSLGALLAAVLTLAHRSRRSRPSKHRTTAEALVAALLLALVAAKGVAAIRENATIGDVKGRAAEIRETVTFLRAQAQNSKVYVLSTDVVPAFPAMNYAPAHWGPRFNCLWFLPAAANDPAVASGNTTRELSGRQLEARARDLVFRDLAANIPDLLLVDESPVKQGIHGPFDLMGFFSEDRRISGLLAQYRELDKVSHFRVMKRRDAAR